MTTPATEQQPAGAVLDGMSAAVYFASGLLFGLGLAISGMINPAKVLGFLDIAGNWDPSLIFVMGAGLAITFPAFHLVLKQDRPLLDHKFYLPTRKDIDSKLIAGAALFGIGWGLAGLCPGPAIAGLVSLEPSIALFVVAMIGGMLLHRLILE